MEPMEPTIADQAWQAYFEALVDHYVSTGQYCHEGAVSMAEWVIEGMADDVALPPSTFVLIPYATAD